MLKYRIWQAVLKRFLPGLTNIMGIVVVRKIMHFNGVERYSMGTRAWCSVHDVHLEYSKWQN